MKPDTEETDYEEEDITRNMTCIICWEEFSATRLAQELDPCKHQACQACIRDWIMTCEKDGQDEASCPHCRQQFSDRTIQSILGRAYQAVARTAEDVSAAEMDEFTLTWLQENGARQCQNCGAWMMPEDGADNIMCLCGFRYCWNCDENADECPCSHDEFYDNLTGRQVRVGGDDRPSVATEEEQQDFRAFLEARLDAAMEAEAQENPVVEVIEEPEEVFLIALFAEYVEEMEAFFIPLFQEYTEDAEAHFVPFTEWEAPTVDRRKKRRKTRPRTDSVARCVSVSAEDCVDRIILERSVTC